MHNYLPDRRERLEVALRDALKSVLGDTGPGANPRMEFYNKFQREMEEHDRDFEKKYDEDLNTTLIFVSVHCAPGVGFEDSLGPDAYCEVLRSLVYSRPWHQRLLSTCNRISSRTMRK